MCNKGLLAKFLLWQRDVLHDTFCGPSDSLYLNANSPSFNRTSLYNLKIKRNIKKEKTLFYQLNDITGDPVKVSKADREALTFTR